MVRRWLGRLVVVVLLHAALLACVGVCVALGAVVVELGVIGRASHMWLDVGSILANVAVNVFIGHGLRGYCE